ncbi:cytochrome P450 [Lentzea sp. NBRC 105346]|uniref:cytochrome P450 n=1 Tax=Lentzea sp. NBRC 105346 TaxID=3032205 RepID=UPI0024A46555|nr:cytochrome P450 [Lentzea sp. NBRC 105346]GLZ33805.1 cytochrome P450 [Lentzea sp. NBRC 105346]
MTGLAVSFNPLDPDTLRDPYPVYAAMRATGAPQWSELMDCWVVTSYRECKRVLVEHETFAADWRRGGDTVPDAALNVHSLDPPEHTPLYRELGTTLRHAATTELPARIRAEVDRRLDALAGEPTNLITAFTEPLACWFLSEVLQIPPLDTPEIRSMGQAIHYAMDAGLVPAAHEPGRRAHRELAALIETWVAEAKPDQPLRAMMDRADEAGLDPRIVVNSVRTLVANAFTSLPSALGTTMYAVGRDETMLRRLTDSAAFDRAAHELLRYESPSQGTTRLAVADTTLSGVRIRRGQAVLAMVGAANHDPEEFEEPDRLRLDRWPNPHLAFGRGAHGCSATALSLVLLRELLATLADLRVSVRLTGDATHKRAATIRMLEILPAVVIR